MPPTPAFAEMICARAGRLLTELAVPAFAITQLVREDQLRLGNSSANLHDGYLPIYFAVTVGAVPPVSVSRFPLTVTAGLFASNATVVVVQVTSAAEMLNQVVPSRLPCNRYVQVAGAPVTISSRV